MWIGKASKSLINSSFCGSKIWKSMDARLDFFSYVLSYFKKKKGGYFETTSYYFFSTSIG